MRVNFQIAFLVALLFFVVGCDKKETESESISNMNRSSQLSIRANVLLLKVKKVILKLRDNVVEKGERPIDQEVLDDVEKAFQKSGELCELIQTMNQNVINKSGGLKSVDNNIIPKEASNKECVNAFFVSGNNDGFGYQLTSKVRLLMKDFTDLETKYDLKRKTQDIVPSGKADPKYKDHIDKHQLDFVQLHFKDKTVTEALVELQQLRLKVAQQTEQLIEQLYKEVGVNTLIN